MRLIDLSDRCLFHLSGPDAESYLNGQVTQDVRNFNPSDPARWACVCTAKGKMQGIVLIHRAKDGFLLDAPAELRDSLFARLDRYLIADDAELIDITGEKLLLHSDEKIQADSIRSNRFGFDGYDTWLSPNEFSAQTADGPLLTEEELEAERISAGVPRWGAELTEDTLPPEAKLEARAISYHKGCYVGQETISRIKSVGRVNRLLTQFTAGSSVEPGVSIYLPVQDGKPVGEITSVAEADGQFIALGYLSRKAADATDFVTTSGSNSATIELKVQR